MGWKKILLIAAGLVTVLILGAVTWLFTANLGVLKPQIERWVTEATGRQFAIDGRLDIRLGSEISLMAEGVRFGNAGWAEESDMVSIGRVAVRLDTRSLFGDPIRIEEATVDDAAILLVRREDGSANWQLSPSLHGDESAESEDSDGAVGVLLRHVDLSNLQLIYSDPKRDGPLDFRIAQFSQQMDDERFLDLELDATLGGREISLTATAGTWDDLLAGQDIDFSLNALVDTLRIDGSGHVDDLMAPGRPRLELSVSGPDLNDLARLLRSEAEFEGDVDLGATLGASDDGPLVLEVSGNLGRMQVEAQGAVQDLESLDQADLDLDVSGPDLGRLLSLFGGPRLPAAPYLIDVEAERNGPELLIRNAHMEYADAVFDLTADIPGLPAIDDSSIRLTIQGERFERFREVTGIPGAATGPYSLTFELVDQGNGAEVIDLQLESTLGNLSAAGTLGNAPDYLGSEARIEARAASLSDLAEAYGLPAMPPRPISLAGDLELVAEGIRSNGPLNVTSNEVTATIDGLLMFAPKLVGSAFAVSGEVPDIAVFAREFVDNEWLPAQPVRADGRIEIASDGYRVPDLHLDVGSNTIDLEALISRQAGLVGSVLSAIVEGPAIEELTENVPGRGFQPGQFTLSANLERTSAGLRVADVDFTRPRGRLGGTVDIGLPFEERSVVFNISGRGADLAAFAGSFGSFEPATRPFNIVLRGNNRRRLLTLDRFDARFGDAELSAQGTVDLEELTGDTRLSLNASMPDLADLGRYNGRAFNSQAFRLQGNVNVNRRTRTLAVDNLAIHVGESDVAGLVTLQAGEPPELTVRVTSDSLRYSPLLEPAEETYDPEPEYDDGRLIPDLPVPFEMLDRLNATVKVDIDELGRGYFETRDFVFSADLKDGEFRLERFGFLTPTGWFEATGGVKHTEGVGELELAVAARDLSLAAIDLNSDSPSRLRVDVNLAARGSDLRSLAASTEGALLVRADSLTIAESVVLKRLYGDLLNEIVSVINPFAETSTQQRLNCIVAPIRITAGKVESAPELLIRTDKLRIVVEALVNLTNERLDLQFATTPRSGITISAGELFNPYVKVVGTLARPRLAVDQQGVLISGGAAVATGGLSVLAQAAWRRLNRSGDPCQSLQEAGLEALGDDAFVTFDAPGNR